MGNEQKCYNRFGLIILDHSTTPFHVPAGWAINSGVTREPPRLTPECKALPGQGIGVLGRFCFKTSGPPLATYHTRRRSGPSCPTTTSSAKGESPFTKKNNSNLKEIPYQVLKVYSQKSLNQQEIQKETLLHSLYLPLRL